MSDTVFDQLDGRKILYHGSKTPRLKALKPQGGCYSLPDEKVVFATSDFRFALAMTYGTGDELAVGYYGDNYQNLQMYIDELQPSKLQLLSQPGWLYYVPASGFKPDKRLAHCEFINPSWVEIIKKVKIDNIFDQLKKYQIDIVEYDNVPAALESRKIGKAFSINPKD